MTRLNALLLLALLVSSVYLVHVAHESRKLFVAFDAARSEERLLGNEFERLKSEKQSQATPLRVEKIARAKLEMRTATPAVTQYISSELAAPAASASAADAGSAVR